MIIFILSQSVENGEERRGHKRERLVKRHEMMVACQYQPPPSMLPPNRAVGHFTPSLSIWFERTQLSLWRE